MARSTPLRTGYYGKEQRPEARDHDEKRESNYAEQTCHFRCSNNNCRRCAAESKVSGHTIAVRELHGWLREFVGRACEGFYEREAVLARYDCD